MNLNQRVTWIAKHRKSAKSLPRNVSQLRVRTGIVGQQRVRADGKLEYEVTLLLISGPLDHGLTDKVWVQQEDLLKWAADEWQHYQPKSPFELLQADVAAQRRRTRNKERDIRRIINGRRSSTEGKEGGRRI